LNESFWSTTPFSIFAQSLFYLLSIPYGSFDFIRIIIGICVIIIGILAMFRSIFTFGFDYMTVIYLYFPEESEIQSHEIYSILRHPTYAALIYICIGSTLIEFSLYSFIFLGFYILGFLIHILLVEEKELIQRFGQSYVEYRKNVPAIFASIRKWPQFFKILFMSKN
jgi:protein-S-isoprenylcysteine O-methyltransferase Ste14